MYYCVEDLSGNILSTRDRHFRTLKKHQPAKFNVILQDDVDKTKLINAFSLVTGTHHLILSLLTMFSLGVQQARWHLMSAPDKFDIPDNTDPNIAEIIKNHTVTYEVMLYQNITADEQSPRQYVEELEISKYLLKENIPQVVDIYNIVENSYEVVHFPQEFVSGPDLDAVSERFADFTVSGKRTGTMFAVVQESHMAQPRAWQIKRNLNATNFFFPDGAYKKVTVNYTEKAFGEYDVHNINFTDLYDFTAYTAYFVAENDLPINPDLMEDDEVVPVEFTTQPEIYSLVDWYKGCPCRYYRVTGTLLSASLSLIALIFTMLALL